MAGKGRGNRLTSTLLTIHCTAVLLNRAGSVEFPLVVDADDVAFFMHDYDLDGLHWALEGTFNLSHRVHGDAGERPLLPDQIARGGGSHYTAQYKLELDLEQARYIAAGGGGGTSVPPTVASRFREEVVPKLERARARVPPLEDLLVAGTGGLHAFGPRDRADGIAAVYNRALHLPWAPELPGGPGAYFGAGGRDVGGVTRRWLAASPRIVVVDDLLSERALEEVRRLLAEATVFYQTKMPER